MTQSSGLTLLRARGTAPPLVVLELTYRCGRDCPVCFHRGSREEKIPQRDMSLALARRVLRLATAAGVARVRLTGGEPLRHPHWEELLGEVRAAGLEAWVNTAGLVDGETPWRALGAMADDVLLPLRKAEQRRDIAVAVEEIRRGGAARVRLGVVLTRPQIAALPELAAFAAERSCPLEAYRVMTVPGHVAGSSASDLKEALEALGRINEGRAPELRVRIANAMPFCVVPQRRRAARHACGGRFDDGRSRLVVAPDGVVRPSYSLQLPLGSVEERSLVELWQHPRLVRLHAAESLPPACQECTSLRVCRGGSRHEAHQASGSLSGMDPLAAYPPWTALGPRRAKRSLAG